VLFDLAVFFLGRVFAYFFREIVFFLSFLKFLCFRLREVLINLFLLIDLFLFDRIILFFLVLNFLYLLVFYHFSNAIFNYIFFSDVNFCIGFFFLSSNFLDFLKMTSVYGIFVIFGVLGDFSTSFNSI